jgi:hypothetical protein
MHSYPPIEAALVAAQPLILVVAPQGLIGWGVTQTGAGLAATPPLTPVATLSGLAAIPQPQLPIP